MYNKTMKRLLAVECAVFVHSSQILAETLGNTAAQSIYNLVTMFNPNESNIKLPSVHDDIAEDIPILPQQRTSKHQNKIWISDSLRRHTFEVHLNSTHDNNIMLDIVIKNLHYTLTYAYIVLSNKKPIADLTHYIKVEIGEIPPSIGKHDKLGVLIFSNFPFAKKADLDFEKKSITLALTEENLIDHLVENYPRGVVKGDTPTEHLIRALIVKEHYIITESHDQTNKKPIVMPLNTVGYLQKDKIDIVNGKDVQNMVTFNKDMATTSESYIMSRFMQAALSATAAEKIGERLVKKIFKNTLLGFPTSSLYIPEFHYSSKNRQSDKTSKKGSAKNQISSLYCYGLRNLAPFVPFHKKSNSCRINEMIFFSSDPRLSGRPAEGYFAESKLLFLRSIAQLVLTTLYQTKKHENEVRVIIPGIDYAIQNRDDSKILVESFYYYVCSIFKKFPNAPSKCEILFRFLLLGEQSLQKENAIDEIRERIKTTDKVCEAFRNAVLGHGTGSLDDETDEDLIEASKIAKIAQKRR